MHKQTHAAATCSELPRFLALLRCRYTYCTMVAPCRFDTGKVMTEAALDQLMKDRLIMKNVTTLCQYGLMETDSDSFQLKPLLPGKLMAQQFLRLATMVEIVKEQQKPNLSGLLEILCKAEEFKNINLRK